MFRFTIRELVLLTLVVAMGAGWWVDRHFLAIKCRELGQRAGDAEMAAEHHQAVEELVQAHADRFQAEWARVLDEVSPEAEAEIMTVYRRIESEKASQPRQQPMSDFSGRFQ
jgi:hypothetical protein